MYYDTNVQCLNDALLEIETNYENLQNRKDDDLEGERISGVANVDEEFTRLLYLTFFPKTQAV